MTQQIDERSLRCEIAPADLARATEELAVARHQLSKRYSALTYAIYATHYVATTEVKTMAMSDRGVCLWNPHFVLARKKNDEVQAALCHEIWHQLRRHSARGDALRSLTPGVTHAECNAGADREINDDLFAAGHSFGADLDEHVLTPAQIGEADGQTMEDYVFAAREKQAQQQQQKQQKGGGAPQESTDGDEAEDEEADSGSDGSPGGDMDDPSGDADGKDGGGGQGSDDDDADGADGGAAGDGDGAAQGGVGTGCCGSAAGSPVDAEAKLPSDAGRAADEIENIRQQVATAIVQEAAAGRGKYPADMVRWAEAMVKPPKVRWQTEFAKTLRGSVSDVAGSGGNTYRRISRRMAGVGYGPGRPVMPGIVSIQPEVQLWIDTSGSIGDIELTAALSELDGILRTVPGRVTVGICDAKVHGLKKVRSVGEAKAMLKGGGGTDFRPLFDAALKARPAPDIVVVVTDGMATIPSVPPDVRVVWVLVGRYAVTTMPWGKCIRVTDE